MSDATPIDTALEGLSDLAACDLRLAKRFCARIEACGDEDDDKAMNLARSYQRMARSYRQTLVVQARLRRELKAEAREDAGEAKAERQAAERARDAALGCHRQRVRRHFERVLWNEYEDDDAQEIFNDVDERLFEISGDSDFLDTPADTLIARLTEEFGIGAGAQEADDDEADEAEAGSSSHDEDDEDDDAPIVAADDPVSAAPPPAPAPEPPDTEPPPRPPDPPPNPPPKPYVPPRELLRPGQRFPGGTGW